MHCSYWSKIERQQQQQQERLPPFHTGVPIRPTPHLVGQFVLFVSLRRRQHRFISTVALYEYACRDTFCLRCSRHSLRVPAISQPTNSNSDYGPQGTSPRSFLSTVCSFHTTHHTTSPRSSGSESHFSFCISIPACFFSSLQSLTICARSQPPSSGFAEVRRGNDRHHCWGRLKIPREVKTVP